MVLMRGIPRASPWVRKIVGPLARSFVPRPICDRVCRGNAYADTRLFFRMQPKPIIDRVFRGNAPAIYLAQGEALGLLCTKDGGPKVRPFFRGNAPAVYLAQGEALGFVVHQRWRAKGPAVYLTQLEALEIIFRVRLERPLLVEGRELVNCRVPIIFASF